MCPVPCVAAARIRRRATERVAAMMTRGQGGFRQARAGRGSVLLRRVVAPCTVEQRLAPGRVAAVARLLRAGPAVLRAVHRRRGARGFLLALLADLAEVDDL